MILNHPESDNVRKMLTKLSELWDTRSAVNKYGGVDKYSDLEFDPDLNDYSETLLPFKDHDAWREAPLGSKSKAMSYAWALYNLKTIYIECDIVTSSCEDLLKIPLPNSANGELIQDVISEALLDEALHTRMSVMASNYICNKRSLEPLAFTDFNLVSWNRELIKNCQSDGERRLARFSVACASETLITDYLQVMSEDSSIQKICHEVTRAHAMDEWSHSSVFSYVATDIVNNLSGSEKRFMRKTIPKTVEMFADNEMGAWEYVFRKINFPYWKDIVADSKSMSPIDVYMESVDKLIDRIGL
ncbi:diiron oxygenase [Halomonas sp. WWR20]